MRFFCKPYSVCTYCRVHFEPHNDGQPFTEYCGTHRQPHLDKWRRYETVMAYAKAHWEELEPAAIAERDKNNQMTQSMLASLASMQQASAPSIATSIGSMAWNYGVQGIK